MPLSKHQIENPTQQIKQNHHQPVMQNQFDPMNIIELKRKFLKKTKKILKKIRNQTRLNFGQEIMMHSFIVFMDRANLEINQ